ALGGDACGCNAPPAPFCLDGTTLRAYVSVGSCGSGACSYTYWDVLCENSCESGACIGNDRCSGVKCVTPPVAAWVDGTTLMTYSQSGTCSKGSCSYKGTHTTCSSGCNNGACQGEPCAGITCNTPPVATCISPTVRRSYSPVGTCSGGTCSYTASDL